MQGLLSDMLQSSSHQQQLSAPAVKGNRDQFRIAGAAILPGRILKGDTCMRISLAFAAQNDRLIWEGLGKGACTASLHPGKDEALNAGV